MSNLVMVLAKLPEAYAPFSPIVDVLPIIPVLFIFLCCFSGFPVLLGVFSEINVFISCFLPRMCFIYRFSEILYSITKLLIFHLPIQARVVSNT